MGFAIGKDTLHIERLCNIYYFSTHFLPSNLAVDTFTLATLQTATFTQINFNKAFKKTFWNCQTCIVTSIFFGLKRYYFLVAFLHCKPHKTLFQPIFVHQWFFVSKIKYNFENNYILSISRHTVCTNKRRAEFSQVNSLHFSFQISPFQCGIISSFLCRKDVTQHVLLKNQLYF